MTESSTLGTYGGPKENAQPVSNPLTQFDADQLNRLFEDVAHMTRTSCKARVVFTATNTAGPTTVAPSSVSAKTQWGSGSSQKPVVTKSADGLYAITFPTTFTDALSKVETLGFFDAEVDVRTGDNADGLDAEVLAVSARAATIAIYSPVGTLDDNGDNSATLLTVSVRFY